MRRIFWDTMLFIYLFEGNVEFRPRVVHLLQQAHERKDQLFTSYLALGEVIVGARSGPKPKTDAIRSLFAEMSFGLVPFDNDCVETFGVLRAKHRLKTPDSINLACAGAAVMDLFLTNDVKLCKLHVPGISFIANMHTDAL